MPILPWFFQQNDKQLYAAMALDLSMFQINATEMTFTMTLHVIVWLIDWLTERGKLVDTLSGFCHCLCYA